MAEPIFLLCPEGWSRLVCSLATGLTVRTLHHYDEIGLVPASEHTDAGHRPENFLDRSQRDALAARRTSLGAAKVEELRTEWVAVVRQHVVDGSPTDDPEVRQAFSTGDATIGAQVSAMREANRERLNEHLTARIGWEGLGDVADVLEYVRRVPL